MNTCESHKNCVVVYTSVSCPLCEAAEREDALNNELADANEKLQKVKDVI